MLTRVLKSLGRFERAIKRRDAPSAPDSVTLKTRGVTHMTSAIIETGGKQYRVKEGDELFIERLPVESEDKVVFDKILAVTDDDGSKIGAPYVTGASVDASVVKNGKSKKIIVYKMHPKKGYRRKQGHRQPYTKVLIEKINA